MPSARYLAALIDPESGDEVVVLATLTHADFTPPLRFAAASADIVSGGQNYLAAPFEFVAPESEPDGGSRPGKLRIANVDASVRALLRSIETPIKATFQVVLKATPDTIEQTYPPGGGVFDLSAVTGDRFAYEAELTTPDDRDEPACRWRYDTVNAPGLY